VVVKYIEAAIKLHGKVLWIGRPYICKKRANEREKYIAG
jgi:hypothetical protein